MFTDDPCCDNGLGFLGQFCVSEWLTKDKEGLGALRGLLAVGILGSDDA